jgi:NAD(P)-dependent dehydrogenase (short-subunit alcohol dehydrogenase family)
MALASRTFAREADVEALFDRTVEAMGPGRRAVCNAGINRDSLLVHTTAERFDEVIAVNLTGPSWWRGAPCRSSWRKGRAAASS